MQLTPNDDDFATHVEVGQMIGERYQINRLLGRGGVGVVYEAENVLIGRKVAIKVLRSHRAYSRSTVKRFEKEARATGNIDSDHILDVIDIGRLPTGEPYLVMELLVGEDLGQRIHRVQKLTPGQLVPLARQALLGLRAAHHAGIIHRDLKPANIFIMKSKAGHSDFVKLIDFGVSKFTDTVSNTSETKPGAVMGTPVYMSPEQAKGDVPIDSRSDIYAIGVILYEALMGHLPFPGKTYNELLFEIVLKSPLPLDKALDENFRGIVDKAMARNPDERFQSCEAFIAALDEFSGVQSMRMAQSPGVGIGEFSKTGKMPAINASPNQASGTVPMAVPRLDALPDNHPAYVAAKEMLTRQPVEAAPGGRAEYEGPHSLRSSPSPQTFIPQERVLVSCEPVPERAAVKNEKMASTEQRSAALAATHISDKRREAEELPTVPLLTSGPSLRVISGMFAGLAVGLAAVFVFSDVKVTGRDQVRDGVPSSAARPAPPSVAPATSSAPLSVAAVPDQASLQPSANPLVTAPDSTGIDSSISGKADVPVPPQIRTTSQAAPRPPTAPSRADDSSVAADVPLPASGIKSTEENAVDREPPTAGFPEPGEAEPSPKPAESPQVEEPLNPSRPDFGY